MRMPSRFAELRSFFYVGPNFRPCDSHTVSASSSLRFSSRGQSSKASSFPSVRGQLRRLRGIFLFGARGKGFVEVELIRGELLLAWLFLDSLALRLFLSYLRYLHLLQVSLL